jgi:hypothetical protein
LVFREALSKVINGLSHYPVFKDRFVLFTRWKSIFRNEQFLILAKLFQIRQARIETFFKNFSVQKFRGRDNDLPLTSTSSGRTFPGRDPRLCLDFQSP